MTYNVSVSQSFIFSRSRTQSPSTLESRTFTLSHVSWRREKTSKTDVRYSEKYDDTFTAEKNHPNLIQEYRMHWEVLTTVQDNLFEYYIYHWKCKEGADRIGQRRVEVYCVVLSSSSSVICYRTFYSYLKKIQLEGPVQSNESMFGVSIEVVWPIVISR